MYVGRYKIFLLWQSETESLCRSLFGGRWVARLAKESKRAEMAAAMAALEAARKSAETNEAKMRVAEKQMRAAFDAIDEDHSGELDTNEILKALEGVASAFRNSAINIR